MEMKRPMLRASGAGVATLSFFGDRKSPRPSLRRLVVALCATAAFTIPGAVTIGGGVAGAVPTTTTVTLVTPNAGPLTGGTPITITGTGFVTGDAVTVGSGSAAALATSVNVVSPTQITATTPVHNAGNYCVYVTSSGGSPSAVSAGCAFGYAAMTVASVAPSSGPLGGGTAITVMGTGFASGDTVVIAQGNGPKNGAVAATGVSVNSPSEITATTGLATRAGAFDVYLIAPGGTPTPSNNAAVFTYLKAPPASLVVGPPSPIGGGGWVSTVAGSGLQPGATVNVFLTAFGTPIGIPETIGTVDPSGDFFGSTGGVPCFFPAEGGFAVSTATNGSPITSNSVDAPC